jgi:hypothetical protein
MAQQTINIGTTPGDGTGDTARDGGAKINSNFTELYGKLFGNYGALSDPTINDDSADGYVQGSFWVNRRTGESWRCLDPAAGAAIWARAGNGYQRTAGDIAGAQEFDGLNVIGDSISTNTTASGSSTVANSYAVKTASRSGRNAPVYLAVSGAQVADQAAQVFARTISGATRSSMVMLGTNDVRVYKNTGLKAVFSEGLLAELAWLATPPTTRFNGQAGTFTGTWANTTVYGGALGKHATTNGATATYTVRGNVVYVCSVYQTPNTGTYTIHVDGVQFGGTFTTAATASMTTGNGISYGPRMHRITGLSNGVHTVVVTSVAVDASNPAYVIFVGGNYGTNLQSTCGQVLCSTIPYFGAAGHTTYGTTDADFDAYNTEIELAVNKLRTDGLNVRLSDLRGLLNVTTDLNADGVHPTDAGHEKIAALRSQDLFNFIRTY